MPKPDAPATSAPPYIVMHRAAMPPTATPAVMHVARDQDVAKVEDARHTRTQGGVQMPACPLERCPPRQARLLCAPFLRLRTPITHLSSVAFASSSSCSHSPYHPHGSRLHRSTRPLEYASPDRRQGCALRHGRRASLALIALERPSPFSNATPHQVEPSSEVQGSQLAEPAARQTAPLRVGNRPPGVAAAKYHMCRRVLGTAGPKMSSPARLPSPELPTDPCSATASCGGPLRC